MCNDKVSVQGYGWLCKAIRTPERLPQTGSHCLHRGGEHALQSHIGLLLDCARSCIQSADFMLRMSQFHGHVCGVCADICNACAQDCEWLANGDQMMSTCTESCCQMATMA